MIVILHVTGLLLLLSIIENRLSSVQHVINNCRRHIFQYETSSLYDHQSAYDISSSQYIDHFESLIYHRLSIANTQIQNQSKPKNLIFKMSVIPSSSGQYMQSYIEIFGSNIPNPFDSARRSRLFSIKIYPISNALYLYMYTTNLYNSNATRKPRVSARE